MKKELTQQDSICYCGHNCLKCVTYRATKSGDDRLRERAQVFYKEEFGQEIPLEQFSCEGGRTDNVFVLCRDCPFRKCCKERGFHACCQCPEYPCRMLKDYEETYVNKSNQTEDE